MSGLKKVSFAQLRKIVRRSRGHDRRALADAARNVAKGSYDRQLEQLAKDVLLAFQLEGIAVE